MAFAIAARRLFTGDDIIEPGLVVVEGRRIAAVGGGEGSPPGMDLIDLGDATILPGLIDAHSHVSIVPADGDQIGQFRRPLDAQLATARKNVALDLASGVTTMRVMGQELDVDFLLKKEIDAGRTPGPSLVCAGVQIAREGNHGHAITGVRTPEDIERVARQNIARGAGLLKIFTTGGVSTGDTPQDACPFSVEDVQLAADIAHAHGIGLAAHAHGGEGARRALEGGVDTIEHAGTFDDDLIALARDLDRTIVGTFSILYHPDGVGRGDASNPAIAAKVQAARDTMAASWRRILAAGIRVALGTDSMHGSLAFDAAKLVEFGASPLDAIRAATVTGARVCGVRDRGRLEPGLRADICAVAGNPFQDISSLSKPVLVIAGGRVAVGSQR